MNHFYLLVCILLLAVGCASTAPVEEPPVSYAEAKKQCRNGKKKSYEDVTDCARRLSKKSSKWLLKP